MDPLRPGRGLLQCLPKLSLLLSRFVTCILLGPSLGARDGVQGVDRLDEHVSFQLNGESNGQPTWGQNFTLSSGSKAHHIDSLGYDYNKQDASKHGKTKRRKTRLSRLRRAVEKLVIFINGTCVRER